MRDAVLIPQDYSGLALKPDASSRPIWITPCHLDPENPLTSKYCTIFLEAFSVFYAQAYDFLIAISEPISRPEHIHMYHMTTYSLFAAASIGLTAEDIITGLTRFSKTEIDDTVVRFVEEKTARCGKIKTVLRKSKYFIETEYPRVLAALLSQSSELRAARLHRSQVEVDEVYGFVVSEQLKDPTKNELFGEEDTPPTVVTTYSIEIQSEMYEVVKKVCKDAGYPMLEEYAFRKETDVSKTIPMSLRPIAQIRRYQEKSLSKMFGNERARSGIIVLPCGAGKTLVGITATCTIAKNTIVVCTSGVAVEQWKSQFKMWSTVSDDAICRLSANKKEVEKLRPDGPPVIVITTYSMLGGDKRKSAVGEEMLREIKNREWGLIVLDEVHVAPAASFRRCLQITKSRCKLGLTATLVREDNKIADLMFLVGPKLYEASWSSLAQQGYIATVKCVEVRCRMTQLFYAEYLKPESHIRRKKALWVMNPTKLQALQYLIRYHEKRGDKIMVFSDDLMPLKTCARSLKRPLIFGGTKLGEQLFLLNDLQSDSEVNTLFVSKVADNSFNLPEVNVIIQISSHFGSRRQEAQRLGRILRPKPVSSTRYNAFFYSLVSDDTKECTYASKRQSFLNDQGYSYQVVRASDLLETDESSEPYLWVTEMEEKTLLSQILSADGNTVFEEEASEDEDERYVLETRKLENEFAQSQQRRKVTRGKGIGKLSGAGATEGVVYEEIQKKKAKKDASKARVVDKLRRQRERGAQRRRQRLEEFERDPFENKE